MPWPAPAQKLTGPIVVDDRTIESLPVAGRCIDLLSSLVSGLPIYGIEKDRPPPRLLAPTRQAEMEWPTQLTISATIRALLTYGNAYWLVVERYANGRPMSVCQLDPSLVSVTRRQTDGMLRYRTHTDEYVAAEIIHFRAHGYPGYGAAAGPVHTLSRLWQIATAEQQIAHEWATRGGQPIGYMTAPTAQLSQAELARQADSFDRYLNTRARQVPVFAPGVEFKSISLSAHDMELIASRQWSSTEICVAYGVPAHLVGVPAVESSTTYSSALMDMSQFVQLTLSHWVRCLEAALRPELGQFSFDLDSLLRASRRERYEAYEIALRSGWLTVDEVREQEKLPPLPEPEIPPQLMVVPDAADDDADDEGRVIPMRESDA